jgi:hypothetical protein
VLLPSFISPFSAPEILAHETHEKTMTMQTQMTNGEKKLTVLLEEFVIRVSAFIRHSSFACHAAAKRRRELSHFY